VVGCGRYCIVGDISAHNYQETILIVGIASFVVKTMGKNSKLTIICFKVLMLLHFLFSLNYVIPS